MAMWVQKIVLTVMAIVPVIAGEIVRLTDCGEPAPAAVVAPRGVADCTLSELRWRTLEPPSAIALPPAVAQARGGAVRGC